MTNIVSVQTMRNSDSNTIANGTPGIELMKRAGEFIFNSVEWHPPVAIVCGSGTNAGDGSVLA
ncbi:MAG: NAD(P)H-hydrate epimerase, partial [Clostridia bacterium]|nr:NAD(P)H-hydrate epimerase [Clostridia bacterium]